jgi:hypothetical protein
VTEPADVGDYPFRLWSCRKSAEPHEIATATELPEDAYQIRHGDAHARGDIHGPGHLRVDERDESVGDVAYV